MVIGQLMAKRGNLAESHGVLQAVLSVQRKVLGDDSLDFLYTLRALSWTLEGESKLEEAEKAHREVMNLWRKRVDFHDPEVLAEIDALVRILVAEKKFHEAEQLLGEALTAEFIKQPASVNLLVQRADLLARRMRWREAAADATLVVGYQPAEHYRYYMLAPLLVKTGDAAACEKLCRKMLATFSDSLNPYVAERTVQSCLLLPNAGMDLQLLDKLADRSVLRASGEAALPAFQVGKAMSSYRLGRFSEAIEWVEKSQADSDIAVQGKAHAIMAMAYWQLGQKDKARAMLAKGEILAPEIVLRDDDEIGGAWPTWLFARLSLDEANALICPTSTKADNKP